MVDTIINLWYPNNCREGKRSERTQGVMIMEKKLEEESKPLKSSFGEVIYKTSLVEVGGCLRNAVVIRQNNGSYIVGKNFIVDEDNEVSWSWGCYDIPDLKKAMSIVDKWTE